MKESRVAFTSSLILPPSSFPWSPQFDFRVVLNDSEQFGVGSSERGVACVRGEFGERREDEAAEGEGRVWRRPASCSIRRRSARSCSGGGRGGPSSATALR